MFRHHASVFSKHHGAELLFDWSDAGHLVRAGEGGAERPDLRCAESARSVEWERV